MARDVNRVLHEIISEQGEKSEFETKAFVKSLKASGRYLLDVY